MHFKFSSRLKSVIIWWRTKKSPPLNGFWLLGFHETGHECTNHLFLWPLVSASVAEAAAAVLPLSMTNHATFCSQSKIKLCAKPSEWFCSCREKGDGGKKMREDFFFLPGQRGAVHQVCGAVGEIFGMPEIWRAVCQWAGGEVRAARGPEIDRQREIDRLKGGWGGCQ